MGYHFVNLTCTDINPSCPIEDTVYGYYPSLGFNAFFVVIFSLFAVLHVALAIRFRTIFIGSVLTAGSLSEAIGYAGRILLWQNPFNATAFSMQISCLIFAPSFIAAAVYIAFKETAAKFGADVSRLRPSWYAWIFIGCDIVCLVLQAAGGGLAGSAGTNETQRDLGTNLMISGIVIQVFTLLVFGGLVVDYVYVRRRQWGAVSAATRAYSHQLSFRLFAAGVVIAYLAILARCAYRIPELVGGWASPLMRDEAPFIVLEGFMVVIAAFSFVAVHPGFSMRVLPNHAGEKRSLTGGSTGSESR